MRRLVLNLAGGALLLAAGTAEQVHAQASADINLQVGDRPAPVVVFEREPDVIMIPNSHVYYVTGLDYDLFRFSRHWYLNNGGYWYRARNYRGPFVAVSYTSVPRSILVVPAKYHRHPMHPQGGPPGRLKRTYVNRDPGPDAAILRDGKRDGRLKGYDKDGNKDGDKGKYRGGDKN